MTGSTWPVASRRDADSDLPTKNGSSTEPVIVTGAPAETVSGAFSVIAAAVGVYGSPIARKKIVLTFLVTTKSPGPPGSHAKPLSMILSVSASGCAGVLESGMSYV